MDKKYIDEFSLVAEELEYSKREIAGMLAYADRLSERHLPVIYNQEHLSLLCGYKNYYLLWVSNFQERFYTGYRIPKKKHGFREIEEPYPALKEIQTWILHNILEPATDEFVSPVAKAFIKGKTLKENARYHRKQKFVISLDIKDFFGNVREPLVYGVFRKFGYCKSVATMLTKLCTLRGVLPQGAPTSPMLSNMIFKRTDDMILRYCRWRKIRYTRYADDLTFSGNEINIRNQIRYIGMMVNNLGLRLNSDKTKVMGTGMRQMVTGIVVNDIMQVSKTYRDKVRQEVYYCIKFGVANHIEHINAAAWLRSPRVYLRHLLGKINFILFVNPSDAEFQKYRNWIKNILLP